jgi:iron complex transport system substrate-binding protein
MTNRLSKIILSLTIGVILITGIFGCTQSTPSATTRTVTDVTGRVVTLPAKVDRIAPLIGPSYDTVFMLGAADKVAMLGIAQTKWAYILYPALANVPTIKNPSAPNLEDLMSKNIQLVLFWDTPDQIKKLTDSGISVFCTLASQSNPETREEWISSAQNAIKVLASALGDNAPANADAYCKYFDDTVKRITSVTSKIPEDKRPTVYYIRGTNASSLLTTHGKYTSTRWWMEMAGANFVTKGVESNTNATVTMEQVISWNPEVIFMGRVNNTAAVLDDPKWSGIKAVKDGRVYLSPNGEYWWESGVEGPLMLMYVAKTLYPDKFTDIDMTKEIKSFYSKFFNYPLTDDQAKRILSFQDPQ